MMWALLFCPINGATGMCGKMECAGAQNAHESGEKFLYIYPSNLKSRASLFFWQLKDVAIIVVLAALGALALSRAGSAAVLAVAAAYAFLSIRFDDMSILDFLKNAFIFCVSGQQLYLWRWPA